MISQEPRGGCDRGGERHTGRADGLANERSRDEELWRRVPRNVLVGLGRLRQRGPGCRLSRGGHRPPRSCAGLRPHPPHDGVRRRSHLRLPPESGRDDRAHGGRTLPGERRRALRRGAGVGRDHRRRGAVRHRERQARFRSCGRLRVERVRRALARRLLARRRRRHRGRDDDDVPRRDPRVDGQARPGGIRTPARSGSRSLSSI